MLAGVDPSPWMALLLGLASTLHCWGMCGGIIAALGLGVAQQPHERSRAQPLIVAAYNLGRVCSYTIAGATAGALGWTLAGGAVQGWIHFALQLVASLILILIALNMGGWLPGLRILESAGAVLWRHIQPIGRPFLPVDAPAKALVIGALWGWIPCGLVYSVLLWSATSTSPIDGAIRMAMFGAGTLPGMYLAGRSASIVRGIALQHRLRSAIALVIILFALLLPALHLQTVFSGGTPAVQHRH